MHMVNIQTTVRSALAGGHPRNQALRHFLHTQPGYELQTGRHGWQAVSRHDEGEDAKRLLRAHGFADEEFQIRVEYQRRWGFL